MGLFWNNSALPIGVDLGNSHLKLTQLKRTKKGVQLLAGTVDTCPEGVEPGSADWQRWAIAALRREISDGRFKGRKVVAAMPASNVFIDHLRAPKVKPDELENAVSVKIESKLPFDRHNAMVRCMESENGHVIAVATDRSIVDRHLAIYEKSAVTLNSICIWPIALANCYTQFFGRRQSDLESVVLLLDIEPECTNLVICRHSNLLYAKSLPVGSNSLTQEGAINTLVMEINACKHQFLSMYRNIKIERVIFVSGQAVETDVCAEIARQLDMRAQMGDCLRAVPSADVFRCGIDRRNSNVNWATSFGLSMSQ